jgi:hypothetical protein
MCTVVYRVKKCSGEEQFISPTSSVGLLSVGNNYTFVSTSEPIITICVEILEVGVGTLVCEEITGFPLLEPYDDNWEVTNEDPCECPKIVSDDCWQLIEFVDPPCSPDYYNVIITEDKECDDCEVCRVKYQLTDCADCTGITNTIIVNWDMSENDFPLDESLVYIFEEVEGIDPEVCWTASSIIEPPCDDLVPSTITISNSDITSTYTDCDECNKPCYKIRDCETLLVVGYSSTTDLSAYAGQTIKWQTQAYLDTDPDPIEWNCGIVEKYICRLETHAPIVDVYVEDCYKTCEECEYVAPEPPEEKIETGRKQQPGYDVPDCETC